MGKYIVQLDNYYLEWSTIVDAPTTWGMKLAHFKRFYRDMYGIKGMEDLPARLERVEQNGYSALNSFDIDFNRAGANETQLTRDEIIEWYCIKQVAPPEGR